MRFLGVWCFVVCFGADSPEETSIALDTFCQTYQQVVRDTRELESILKLNRTMRNRIQGNDLEFLCRCQGWKSDPQKKAACTSTGR